MGNNLPSVQLLIVLLLLFAVLFGLMYFGAPIYKRNELKLLRQELLLCEVPICVGCGYLLTGTSGPSCPEYGRMFNQNTQNGYQPHMNA